MTNTANLPTDTTHRLGELQRVYVPNSAITEYADLVAEKLIRRGRDGFIAWTGKGALLMLDAHVAADAKAYPTC